MINVLNSSCLDVSNQTLSPLILTSPLPIKEMSIKAING